MAEQYEKAMLDAVARGDHAEVKRLQNLMGDYKKKFKKMKKVDKMSLLKRTVKGLGFLGKILTIGDIANDIRECYAKEKCDSKTQ